MWPFWDAGQARDRAEYPLSPSFPLAVGPEDSLPSSGWGIPAEGQVQILRE